MFSVGGELVEAYNVVFLGVDDIAGQARGYRKNEQDHGMYYY